MVLMQGKIMCKGAGTITSKYLHLHQSGVLKGKPKKKKGYMENIQKAYRLTISK